MLDADSYLGPGDLHVDTFVCHSKFRGKQMNLYCSKQQITDLWLLP